jgi:hypothetical protein
MNRIPRLLLVLSAFAVLGCQEAARPSTVIQLDTLNASGVTGSVTLADMGDGSTKVDINVEPAGNLDMPAHIHPGSCAAPVPQPKHPLQNVVNGKSTTVVPSTLAELSSGDLMVNLHKSNDDLRTYTACADL